MTTKTYPMTQINKDASLRQWGTSVSGFSTMIITEESENMLHLQTPVGTVHLTRDGGFTFVGSYNGLRIVFLDVPVSPITIFWKR